MPSGNGFNGFVELPQSGSEGLVGHPLHRRRGRDIREISYDYQPAGLPELCDKCLVITGELCRLMAVQEIVHADADGDERRPCRIELSELFIDRIGRRSTRCGKVDQGGTRMLPLYSCKELIDVPAAISRA